MLATSPAVCTLARVLRTDLRLDFQSYIFCVQGAKVVPLVASILIGAAIRFVVPIPHGVTTQAWTLLSIFVSTIAGQRPTATPASVAPNFPLQVYS